MTESLRALLVALAEPLLDPASRTFLPALVAGGIVAAAFVVIQQGGWRPGLQALSRGLLSPAAWTHRSTRLDAQLLLARQLLGLIRFAPAAGGAWWLATSLVGQLDQRFGVPDLSVPAWAASLTYTAVLFVAWDASRYALHRLMHAVPALWALHQVHHSAEVLTPLAFHRVHPLESLLYQARGALVTGLVAGGFFWLSRGTAAEITVLGVHAIGFGLNALTGNLRHSHVWMGFGPVVERWLISPAQHQLHHADQAHLQQANYGTWLAIWDRLGGSLVPAGAVAPSAYGLAHADRNHDPHDLVSALFHPIVAALSHLGPRRAVAAATLLSVTARAAEPPPATHVTEEDDDILEVLVENEGGVPRAAGAAYVIDEEALEQHEYDDVHKILAQVPGVVTRDEDGFGLRPNIGIRGANSDRSAKLTLMEDGVLFAPAPYAAPAAYYFPMSTRLTGVEVFKGAAATRFGPHTIGGAINLRTREVPTAPVGMVDLAAGLRNTIKVHAFGGYGTERWGLLLEGVHLGTGGFKQLDGGGPTGFERTELMLKTRLASDPERHVRHTLELKGGYGREVSDETYLGLSIEDVGDTPYRRYAASALDHMGWHRGQAEAAWLVRIGDLADVRTVAYYHHLDRAWTKLNRFAGGPDLHALLSRPAGGQAAVYLDILRGQEDSTSDDQTLQIGTNDRRFHSMGLQSTAHWRATRGIVASQLEVGVRLHGDIVDRLHTEDPFAMRGGTLRATGADTLTLLDSHTTALAFAAHVHEDLGIGPVRLLPGMRVEVIQTQATEAGLDPEEPITRVVPLPGMALHAEATYWLDVFAGAHRGFSPVAPGQPAEVQPETAWSYELGARIHERSFRAEAVGFLSDYDNVTGQCTASGGCDVTQIDQQYNGGAAFIYGVETVVSQTVRLPAELGLHLQGTYAYTGSQFRTDFVSGFPQFGRVRAGDAMPYVPEHQGSLHLSLSHPRFSLSVAMQSRSAMRDVAGQGEIDASALIPANTVVDLAMSVQISRHIAAYATVTNLGGSDAIASWRPFGARPVAPLQAMFGVKLRLPGEG